MTDASVAHVYYTRVSTTSPPGERYLNWLSEEERVRYRRFRFDVDRRIFLMAHALVRSVVGEWAGVDPSVLLFETADSGKPVVAEGSCGEDIHFNLSHTRGLVACAVSRVCPVGVDVEGIDVGRDVSGVARRVFSVAEYQDWKALTGEAQARRFFQYWTLKEAYIKALGVRMDLALGDISFTLRPDGSATVSTAQPDHPWLLRTYQPERGYLLSVALQPAFPDAPIRLRQRTP